MRELLPWDDVFSVGHPDLDAEHRRMIELINHVCDREGRDRCQDALGTALEALERIASDHFAHEESILDSIQNATANVELRKTVNSIVATHHGAHENSLSALHTLKDSCDNKNNYVQDTLCENLKTWFIFHAINYDSQVKMVIQSA